MIRLIIFLGLIYFGYKIVKSKLLQYFSVFNIGNYHQNDGDDIMVKDPVCEVYFPKREGVRLRIGEQDFYFCSTECRDKFLSMRSK